MRYILHLEIARADPRYITSAGLDLTRTGSPLIGRSQWRVTCSYTDSSLVVVDMMSPVQQLVTDTVSLDVSISLSSVQSATF